MLKKKYSKKIKFTAYFLLLIFSIIIIEILSFSFLSVYDFSQSKNYEDILKNRKSEFNQAFKKITIFGNYDPVQLFYHTPDSKYGGYLNVNEYGAIKNSSTDDIDFLDKKEDEFRVIMLGGSSLAGSGAKKNSQTIPSILEKYLNKRDDNKKYRVINYGAAGGNTGAEAIKFFQYLIYLEPDMVITLDGFNDTWNYVFENKRVGIKYPIINWSDQSYKLFELLNGYPSSKAKKKPIPPLIYASTVINKLKYRYDLKTKKDKEEFYKDFPMYKISKQKKEDKGFLSEMFKNNISMFANHACRNEILYLSILQPHAYDNYDGLTLNELEKIQKYEYKYNETIIDTKNYIKVFNKEYDDLKVTMNNLSESYIDCKNVNFLNLTSVFKGHKKDVYEDNIHYTPYGNSIIADKIYQTINKKLL